MFETRLFGKIGRDWLDTLEVDFITQGSKVSHGIP